MKALNIQNRLPASGCLSSPVGYFGSEHPTSKVTSSSSCRAPLMQSSISARPLQRADMRVASMDGQEESTALSVTTTRGCSTCQVRGPVVTSYWNAATYTSKDEVEASVCELSPHAQHQPPEIRLTKLYKRWRQGNVRARQISPHSRVLVVDFMLRGRGGYPFMKPNWEIDEQNAAQRKAILELLCLSNTMLSKKTRTPTDGEAAHKDTKHPKGKAGGKKGSSRRGDNERKKDGRENHVPICLPCLFSSCFFSFNQDPGSGQLSNMTCGAYTAQAPCCMALRGR